MTFSKRCAPLVGAVAALALAAGCVSKSYPEKRRYVFEVERTGNPAALGRGALRIDRMRVSPLFERKAFVYRTGDDLYENDFYNEFFSPPGVLLRRTTRRWLYESAIFSSVLGAADSTRAHWLLEGRVGQLYGDLRDRSAPRAVLSIDFKLFDARSTNLDLVFQKRYFVESPASRPTGPAIVAAWNLSLGRILAKLEADLRREVSSRTARP